MFDAKEFEAAYAAALPKHEEAHVAALASVGAPAPAGGLQGGFCANWSKIEGTLNAILGIPFLGWFVPGFATYAPMVKAFLTAADQTLIPAVCGTASGSGQLRPVGPDTGTGSATGGAQKRS